MIMSMRKRLAMSAKREEEKQGFTLTEIAIVLGIIGLILGAIWVAAASVYTNLRTSRATTELLTITQNIRAMYATSSTVDATADMTTLPFTGVAAGAKTTYIQAGVFPSDMVSLPAAGTYSVQNPWGGSVNVVSAKTTTTGDSFSVEMDIVPQSACISMLTSNTGNGRDSGLYEATAGASGALIVGAAAALAATAFPVGAGTAQGLCAAATNNVAFSFKLKG